MIVFKLSEATAARRRLPVYLVDVTDGFTPETGLTGGSAPTIRVSKNGAASAAGAGNWAEVDSANAPGVYYYQLTAGELDTLGFLTVHVSDAAIRSFVGIGQVEEAVALTEAAIAVAVWDEILTGATHNINTSAGKRLRQIQENLGYENGAVYIDTINGNPGTVTFENGTVGNPSSNITDALALAVALGLRMFIVYPGSNITLVADVDGYVMKGIHWTLALGGRSISGSGFLGANVSGTGTGASPPHFWDCFIGVVTLPLHHFHQCAIENTVSLADVGAYFWDQCYSGVAGLDTPAVGFVVAGNCMLNNRHYSGGIEVLNMDAGDVMSLEGGGQLVIAASCAGGLIAIRGPFDKTDNAGGAVTLSEDARLTLTGIRGEIMGYVLEGNILGLTMEQSMNFIRKVARNELVQADGDTDNLVLKDDDGSDLFKWDVQAKSGGPIVQPAVAPARRIPS